LTGPTLFTIFTRRLEAADAALTRGFSRHTSVERARILRAEGIRRAE